MVADIAEALVREKRHPPGWQLRVQDKKADAAGEHVDGSHRVARRLRHARRAWHCAWGKNHLAEVSLDHHLHGACSRHVSHRAQHLERPPGAVGLRGPVVLLAAGAKIPQHLVAPHGAQLHGLTEIHEAQPPILDEQVLERDVAMADVATMEKANRLQQLPHRRPKEQLIQLSAVRRHLEELSLAAELGHEPCVRAVAEAPQHPEQARASFRLAGQVLKDPDLVERILRDRSRSTCAMSLPVVRLAIPAAIHPEVLHLLYHDLEALSRVSLKQL
mmetsp:Transcript_125529/g.280111  ORF Transcript_125529/g.280111 Transcript_125529/m.280111 type:complete len:274 (-) Transcript_125529:52-873(-)